MQSFETIDDVREWLAPLGYDAFWYAVAPHSLFSDGDRAHCDRTVADGIATYETVLEVVKAIARIALTERHGLRYRSCLPPKVELAVVK
ncbi:MAG: hypothetical protein AAF601_01725 [Pseudomonadota bacterium]